VDLNERVANLSAGEREVLVLLLQHSDGKLVGRALGVSTSAVDKRLAGARRKLGVTRSIDAALMLAQVEGLHAGRTVQVCSSTPVSGSVTMEGTGSFEGRGAAWRSLLPTRERPFNALPLWARNVWIVSFLLVLIVSSVLTVSIAEGLSRLHRTGSQGAAATRGTR
jgi:DNA-binding CsgD family transcriptional regulator